LRIPVLHETGHVCAASPRGMILRKYVSLPRFSRVAVPDLQLNLPARAENVAVVRHALGGLGDALGLDPAALADVKLAVTEACTNVVMHAYPDGVDGELWVSATLGEDSIVIAVRDAGRGITPRPDSPGLGLGLPLIASLAEHLEVGSDAGDATTEVTMVFRLQVPVA